MDKNLYIDASHPDETRIVLKSKLSIEEYEYEDKNRVNFKNNIYLGTISRVEPSLQAAFVDFGRVKHGFLAFNDIQSDYYQIPSEVKEKLKNVEEKMREDLKNTNLEEINNNQETQNISEKNGNTEEQIKMQIMLLSEPKAIMKKPQKYLRSKKYRIQEVIKPGQVILIQVLKEERGSKELLSQLLYL